MRTMQAGGESLAFGATGFCDDFGIIQVEKVFKNM